MYARFIVIFSLTIMISLSGASRIYATVLIRHNILELTSLSTTIVEGRVCAINEKHTPAGFPFREITIEVKETLKGKKCQSVIFKLPGGKRADGLYVGVPGCPSFQNGEDIIVFLEGEKSEIVTGFSQGKFRIERISDKDYAVQKTRGVCLLDARKPRKGSERGPVTDWTEKFVSPDVCETALMKPSVKSQQGPSRLTVPLSLFKDTVRACVGLSCKGEATR